MPDPTSDVARDDADLHARLDRLEELARELRELIVELVTTSAADDEEALVVTVTEPRADDGLAGVVIAAAAMLLSALHDDTTTSPAHAAPEHGDRARPAGGLDDVDAARVAELAAAVGRAHALAVAVAGTVEQVVGIAGAVDQALVELAGEVELGHRYDVLATATGLYRLEEVLAPQARALRRWEDEGTRPGFY
jgi:hypothetical protein